MQSIAGLSVGQVCGSAVSGKVDCRYSPHSFWLPGTVPDATRETDRLPHVRLDSAGINIRWYLAPGSLMRFLLTLKNYVPLVPAQSLAESRSAPPISR